MVLARYGVVLGLAATVICTSIAAALAGTSTHLQLVRTLGFDLDALLRWRFWIIPLAPFVQADSSIGIPFLELMLLTVAAVVLLAHEAGQRFTVAIFFGTGVVSSLVTIGVLWLAASAGSEEANRVIHIPDTGVSACAYGTLTAAFMLFQGRLRFLALGGLGLWLGSGFFDGRLDVATAHMSAALAGCLAAAWKLQRMKIEAKRARGHSR